MNHTRDKISFCSNNTVMACVHSIIGIIISSIINDTSLKDACREGA